MVNVDLARKAKFSMIQLFFFSLENQNIWILTAFLNRDNMGKYLLCLHQRLIGHHSLETPKHCQYIHSIFLYLEMETGPFSDNRISANTGIYLNASASQSIPSHFILQLFLPSSRVIVLRKKIKLYTRGKLKSDHGNVCPLIHSVFCVVSI